MIGPPTESEGWSAVASLMQKAAQTNPNSADVFAQLGFLHVKLNQHEQAVEAYQKAIRQIDETEAKAINDVGRIA